jgi:histidinol dehydrogenase
MRRVYVQEASADGLRAIGPEAAVLARAEALEAHARAVDIRLDAAAAAQPARRRA